jgi:hypothetical protein
LRLKRNLTITEAAELTGLTRKAMARRVERGSVRSVLRSGRRLIPRSELIRVGLLPSEWEMGVGPMADSGFAAQQVASSHQTHGEQSLMVILARELMEVLQRQAGELARYRALTVEAESLQLEREVADLRVRLSLLEGGATERALERGSYSEEVAPPQRRSVERTERPRGAASSEGGLWLPPTAASSPKGLTPDAVAATWSTQASAAESRTRRSRVLSLAAEILFIGLVALLAWRASVGPAIAIAAVGVAWLVAATFELVRWMNR